MLALRKHVIIIVMKQLHVSKPHCLIVTGLPGSGKTQFARAFADAFGAPFLDTLAMRSYINEDYPADEFINEIINQFLRTKSTIVVEASTGSRVERQDLIRRAKAQGYTSLVVWVQTELAIAKKRSTVSTRNHTAYYTLDEFEKSARKFTPPNESEPTIVISGMHTQPSQLRVVLRRITQETGRDKINLTQIERTSSPAPSSRRLVQ